MKKINKMCPLCYIKKLFTPQSKITTYVGKPFNNGVCNTPPMGWSSWNSFRNQISEKLILDTADAFIKSGLQDAGYQYINLDDCWQSSLRDKNGDLQGDLTTFPHGIPDLVKKLNEKGLKVGAYTSNGTLTCEDLPASLDREDQDAYTFAKWGIEFFKYDYCHHHHLSQYGPLVCTLVLSKLGTDKQIVLSSDTAHLEGNAKVMSDKRMPTKCFVSGLDRNSGAMTFENIYIDEAGEYGFTLVVKKHGNYEKYAMAKINKDDYYEIKIPACNTPFNRTARCQIKVKFKKGNNTIRIFNPIGSKADSAMILYQRMGIALQNATERVALETGKPNKPIAYSICEWGKNQPYLWGTNAGNLWRTTMDIRPWFFWIKHIYRKTVKLYKYVGKCNWNDPDMLEVGNGKLTRDENIAHFTLWCMMSAPLILGNDLRKFVNEDGTVDKENETLEIVTNKNLIAIDQDKLGKPAKPIKKGLVDLLARPVEKGTAVCVFNKTKHAKHYTIRLNKLAEDKYLNFEIKDNLTAVDQWTNENIEIINNKIKYKLPAHSVKIFIIK